jgi:ribosomal protein L32
VRHNEKPYAPRQNGKLRESVQRKNARRLHVELKSPLSIASTGAHWTGRKRPDRSSTPWVRDGKTATTRTSLT